eukprot:jgi/Picre1/29188/NNA_004581.t1
MADNRDPEQILAANHGEGEALLAVVDLTVDNNRVDLGIDPELPNVLKRAIDSVSNTLGKRKRGVDQDIDTHETYKAKAESFQEKFAICMANFNDLILEVKANRRAISSYQNSPALTEREKEAFRQVGEEMDSFLARFEAQR